MATNFSSVGFDIGSQKEMEALIVKVTPQSEPVPTYVGGEYLRYATPEGCELWAQFSPDKEFVGCNPHFAGSSRFRVQVVGVQAHGAAPLDGQLIAELADYQTAVPIIINVPDYRQYAARLQTPAEAVVQITAFAQDLQLFASFDELSTSGVAAMASEAMIPTGTMRLEGGKTQSRDPPIPLAYLSGHIRSADRLQNSLSNLPFFAMQVKTLGGVIDVVADVEYVGREPLVDTIVVGSFFLSGRLVSPLPKPPEPLSAEDQMFISALRARVAASAKRERTSWWTRLFRRT